MLTRQSEALPQKKRALRGRRLVVVDIENMNGGAVLTTDEAAEVRDRLQIATGIEGGEQLVIGISHIGVLPTHMAWPQPRLVVRSGQDGADLALLDVLRDERVEERFDEVVLASGDGIFTDEVARLGRARVKVTVVGQAGHVSRRLQVAAARTIFLPMTVAEAGGAA